MKRLNSDLVFWACLIAVVAFSFAVRALSAGGGLPYVHNWDEPQIANTALQMLKSGDFNPHFFNYGTLLIYLNYLVDLVHYLYLMGQPETSDSYLTSLNDIQTGAETGWPWSVSHPSFYYWNRMTTVVLGTGTVIFTYLIAREALASRWLGLLAALFLGSLGIHISHSALITNDAPVAFFVLGSVYLSLLFLARGSTGYLAGSLAFCGLAAAAKYNSAAATLLPATVVAIRYFQHRASFRPVWLAMIPLVPLATFLLAMPYAFLDISNFLEGIGAEVRHYKVDGHLGATSEPGMEHIRYQLQQFQENLGTPLLLLSVIGLTGIFIRAKLLLALLVPGFYFLYMTQMTVNFHRNFILVYPFISILIASAALVIHGSLRRICVKFAPASDHRLPLIITSVAFLALAAGPSLHAWDSALSEANDPETRSRAVLRLNAAGDHRQVFIASELRIHEQDLRRLQRPYKLMTLEEIRQCPGGETAAVLMLPANPDTFYSGALALNYRELENAGKAALDALSDTDIIDRIGGDKALHLDALTLNPGIVLAHSRPQVCGPKNTPIPTSLMHFSKQFPVSDEGEIAMVWSGYVELPEFQLEQGDYVLKLQHRGMPAEGQNAQLRVTLQDTSAGVVAGSWEVTSDTRYREEEILIKVPQAGRYTVRIEYVNDFFSNRTMEDRNAYIGSVSLRLKERASRG